MIRQGMHVAVRADAPLDGGGFYRYYWWRDYILMTHPAPPPPTGIVKQVKNDGTVIIEPDPDWQLAHYGAVRAAVRNVTEIPNE